MHLILSTLISQMTTHIIIEGYTKKKHPLISLNTSKCLTNQLVSRSCWEASTSEPLFTVASSKVFLACKKYMLLLCMNNECISLRKTIEGKTQDLPCTSAIAWKNSCTMIPLGHHWYQAPLRYWREGCTNSCFSCHWVETWSNQTIENIKKSNFTPNPNI